LGSVLLNKVVWSGWFRGSNHNRSFLDLRLADAVVVFARNSGRDRLRSSFLNDSFAELAFAALSDFLIDTQHLFFRVDLTELVKVVHVSCEKGNDEQRSKTVVSWASWVRMRTFSSNLGFGFLKLVTGKDAWWECSSIIQSLAA
jgi:hypothetical protein